MSFPGGASAIWRQWTGRFSRLPPAPSDFLDQNLEQNYAEWQQGRLRDEDPTSIVGRFGPAIDAGFVDDSLAGLLASAYWYRVGGAARLKAGLWDYQAWLDYFLPNQDTDAGELANFNARVAYLYQYAGVLQAAGVSKAALDQYLAAIGMVYGRPVPTGTFSTVAVATNSAGQTVVPTNVYGVVQEPYAPIATPVSTIPPEATPVPSTSLTAQPNPQGTGWIDIAVTDPDALPAPTLSGPIRAVTSVPTGTAGPGAPLTAEAAGGTLGAVASLAGAAGSDVSPRAAIGLFTDWRVWGVVALVILLALAASKRRR